jgi:hypothetical protein
MSQGLAYGKIGLAMCIIGSYVVVGKLLVDHVPVMLASLLRFLIASLLLLPYQH